MLLHCQQMRVVKQQLQEHLLAAQLRNCQVNNVACSLNACSIRMLFTGRHGMQRAPKDNNALYASTQLALSKVACLSSAFEKKPSEA